MSDKIGFRIERGFHYLVMMFVVMVIALSLFVVYRAVTPKHAMPSEVSKENENKGTAKPLPDFIVDDIPHNELEMLKP